MTLVARLFEQCQHLVVRSPHVWNRRDRSPHAPDRPRQANASPGPAGVSERIGPAIELITFEPVSANALNPPNPHECWATPKEIAALIRQAREDRKLTQHALAQRMGKKQAEVARWESGATIVKMPTLSRIAEALGFELVVHFGPRTSA